MTAHTNQSGAPAARSRRPRWLLPVLVAAVLAIALVIGGFLSGTVVLYAFSMGGMLLMHVRGHGGEGSGHAAHRAHERADSQAEARNQSRKGGGCDEAVETPTAGTT